MGFERAGLVVPASVAGHRGLFQLDTGVRVTLPRLSLDLCGIPYQLGKAVNWDILPGAHWATVTDVSLGDFHVDRQKVIVWDDRG